MTKTRRNKWRKIYKPHRPKASKKLIRHLKKMTTAQRRKHEAKLKSTPERRVPLPIDPKMFIRAALG